MKSFNFKITDEIFNALPEFKVAGVYLTNIVTKNERLYTIEGIIDNLIPNILKRKNYFDRSKTVIAWTKVFKELGLKSDEVLPSHIALTKRVCKNAQLIRINDIVDLYNIVSLYHSIPLGGHDVRTISNIAIAKTKGGEQFKVMNSDKFEDVGVNEYAYLDQDTNHVLTRNLVWRQADYSKVTNQTNELFIPIDDAAGIYSFEALEDIAKEFIGLFSLFFDFDYKFAIASKYNPQLNFDNISYKPELKIPKVLLANSPVITTQDEVAKFFDRKIDQIYPSADEFKKALHSGKRLKFYMGADCTAPRLHIGHIIPFMKMAELQKLGHQIIFLIGDFTGRMGDPTDKSTARTQLTPEQGAENALEFQKQVAKIIDFEDKNNPALMVFNSTWNEALKFQDVIELCTNFTVQQLLERDMFQKRLKDNKPIYLHEFMYPLMQGYDSVFMEIDGEFGGVDQTFNMLAGRHMMKNIKDMDKFVLTVPTLLSSDGVTKMSKSIGNCIFLTDSPMDKFGKIMAIPDDLIIHYYQLVTKLNDTAIQHISEQIKNKELEPMQAKKDLAYELVNMLDGQIAATEAKNYFEKTIQEGEAPDDTPNIKKDEIIAKLGSAPTLKDLLVYLELAQSNAEAKRLIQSGAIEIDNTKFRDISQTIPLQDIKLIKSGKRNWRKLID
jgi:tyrosyl-tRNA synthetase